MKKVLCIISGGMDSVTMLHHLKASGHDVCGISFNYGQRHKKELEYARSACESVGASWEVCDLSNLTPLLARSALTNDEINVPHGHYAAESMKATVVPNRNMIMLAVATGYAITLECDAVAYGAHFGDHAIYPDCRKEFADALNEAIKLCDWQSLELIRPFVEIDKTEIARIGGRLGIDYSKTWSCYEGQDIHCGKCGTCIERREALRDAGVKDPTVYAADAPDLDAILSSHEADSPAGGGT